MPPAKKRKHLAPPQLPSSVLVLGTRGLKARHRHLMRDCLRLLPHGKPGLKLDAFEAGLGEVVTACEDANCNTALLFDARDPKRLYLWAAGCPAGPSAMLRVQNVHTVAELNMDAHRCGGVRNLLAFDKAFEISSERRVLKALLTRVFSVPRGAVKRVATARDKAGAASALDELQDELQALEAETVIASSGSASRASNGAAVDGGDDTAAEEPEEQEDEYDDENDLSDDGEGEAAANGAANGHSKGGSGSGAAVERVKHALSFSWVDDRIWVRVYRIGKGPSGKMDVEEIGPRMTLEPVRIIAGGFGGAILSTNDNRRKGDDSDEGY